MDRRWVEQIIEDQEKSQVRQSKDIIIFPDFFYGNFGTWLKSWLSLIIITFDVLFWKNDVFL